MDVDLNYYKNIQGSNGATSKRDVILRHTRANFINKIEDSVAYKPLAKRNNIVQSVLITPKRDSAKPFKSTIIALPGDNLYTGDLIESDGNVWLIIDINAINPIQTTGTAWLCNQLFHFQNLDSTIIERWGVLDDGSYSVTSDDQIQVLRDKYKIYLPYDDDTKKLYVDKRLATNKSFDKDGKEILTTYKITGFDPVSKNYGQGGHLLVLSIESSGYIPNEDNVKEMICNYIAPSDEPIDPPSPTQLPCSITTKRSSLYTGTSFTFAATFYKDDGVTEDTSVAAVWTIAPAIEGIISVSNGNSIKISVANNDNLVGETFTLSVTDTDGLYNTAACNVEVI